MNLQKGLILLLVCIFMVTGVVSCAQTEHAMVKTERAVVSTGKFIKERAHMSDKFEYSPEDPGYWQMWQDSQGGG
jgi:hypothetical protein